MKRSIEKLIIEYDKKYANTNSTIREQLYSDDMLQIMNIAKAKMKGRKYCSAEELMFYAIITTWKAGVIVGAKRKKK